VIVIDSSYALSLVMPDEQRPASMRQVVRDQLATSLIWPLEIANAMRSSLRRGRLVQRQVLGLFAQLAELEVDVVAPGHAVPQRHFEAAQLHELTPYDAMYLELALQWRCPLATRDAGLASAARRAGVAVHE
jgi:predicted nucleic acid-binding protein